MAVRQREEFLLNRKEIIEALKAEDFSQVYKRAKEICERTKGNVVYMRAIIEFSNVCNRGCAYCGLNKYNKKIRRYNMTEQEIIERANEAILAGYKTIVLQSGENVRIDLPKMKRIIQFITGKGVAVTLSCGELPREYYEQLRAFGADRYLLKHETSDESIYNNIHSDGSLKERVACLKTLKEIGFETGSGFMIGLPGQSIETIADDLLLLKEIGCDMAGIGPFIPHPDTPLRDHEKGSTELTKRAVAIARILLPEANLPVTTSLGVLDKKERLAAFDCGANVIMKKVTPDEYKDAYQIYPAEIPEIRVEEDRKNIVTMLEGIGKKGV